MSNQDWLFAHSAPLSVAAAAAGLSGEAKKQVNGLGWIVAQHKRLMALEENESREAYNKLDRKTQQALQSLFGETEYNPEKLSLFGSAKKYIGEAFTGGMDKLIEIGELIPGRVYRAAVTADDFGSFGEAFKKASDGNRIFDADREEAVDKFYGPVVSKIAKRISMGDTIGQIVLDLKTDEEFNAVRRLMEGDQEFINALRDYDQSKISIGRSFAHLFNLDPNIGKTQQGAEGVAFKLVSGTADLATTVAFDPTMWLFGTMSAVRRAQYGVMQLARAEAGSLSGMQKTLSFFGKDISFEGAFKNQNIRKTFDEVGSLVKRASDKSLGQDEKIAARVRIREITPFFDDNAIQKLIEDKVYSADDMLRWIDRGKQIDNILVGRPGSEAAMLPNNGGRAIVRRTMHSFVNRAIGYDKTGEFEDTFKAAGGLAKMMNAESAGEGIQRKAFNRFFNWAAKMTDRALMDRTVYTGGTDEVTGRLAKAKSSQTIYTLARTIYDKKTARGLSQAFVGMSEEESRNLVKGLYLTIGDRSGLRRTVETKNAFDRIVNDTFNGVYGEQIIADDIIAEIGGIAKGTAINAAEVNGKQVAVSIAQTSHQMMLPSFREIETLLVKSKKFGEIQVGLRTGNQLTVDFWSALNLLPRLGLRSVLDEGLFSYLTVPGRVARHAVQGFVAGATQRLTAGIQGRKDVGFVTRHVLAPIITRGVSKQDLIAASRDTEFAAELLEKQLIKTAVGKVVFFGDKGAERARYVSDMVRYGNLSHMKGLTENQSKSYLVSTPAPAVGESAIDISESLAKAAKEAKLLLHGGVPTEISRSGSQDMLFNINFMHQLIHRVDLNGEIGQIVARNFYKIEDPVEAGKKSVAEIKKLLDDPKNGIYERFERKGLTQGDSQADAFNMFLHVRNSLVDNQGNINRKLIEKMRKLDKDGNQVLDKNKRPVFAAAHLDIEDINDLGDMLPSRILGYNKKIEITEDFFSFFGKGVNRLFEIMDRQVATLSREPSVYMWTIYNREMLAPLEIARREALKKMGYSDEAAYDGAARWASAHATELSLNRVIGFIDNPNVRSNAAYKMRNFARYARATEDFYRRVGRAVSPRALIRLRLAAQTLENVGFIHEDENGEKYFTFPVDEIMFNAYAAFANRVMGQQIYKPMPLALTGKIRMLTPSLDPSSNIPSLAGPTAALLWTGIKNFLPDELLPEEAKPGIQKFLFGNFAEGQSFWDQITPVNVKRVGNIIATLESDMQNEQLASAYMKAISMYMANGILPEGGENATPSQREQYLYDVRVSTRNIVFLRNFLGIFSPVAPQIAEIQDIDKDVLKAGIGSFRSEFRDIVNKQVEAGNLDPWNTALVKWTKINPGKLAYTVYETETDAVAPIRKTKEAVNWLMKNENLAKKYRVASIFLMPQVDGFDMEAYMFLKREGYQKRKDLDKYFEEVLTINASNEYDSVRKSYEDRILYADTPEEISALKAEKDAALDSITSANPSLRRVFEQRSGTTALKESVVADMRLMLSSGDVPSSSTTRKLAEMVREFDRSYGIIKSITAYTDSASENRKALRSDAMLRLSAIAGSDPNAVSFYENILKRLLD